MTASRVEFSYKASRGAVPAVLAHVFVFLPSLALLKSSCGHLPGRGTHCCSTQHLLEQPPAEALAQLSVPTTCTRAVQLCRRPGCPRLAVSQGLPPHAAPASVCATWRAVPFSSAPA